MNKMALTIGLAAMLLAGGAQAQGWKAPRNAMGQPDLEGGWTNATMTPQTRAPQYGTRRAMTAEEEHHARRIQPLARHQDVQHKELLEKALVS
jgi:hypothetical protein